MPLTNATNAPRSRTSALSASTRKYPLNASSWPCSSTSALTHAARPALKAKASRLAASITARFAAAQQTKLASQGVSTSSIRPMEVRGMESPFEFVQLAHVHRGESLANAEHEDTEHHDRDHDVEE